MFYDIYVDLCKQKGISLSKAAESVGLSRTTVVKWKAGTTPSGATLNSIAQFFGVSVDYLLGNEQKEKPAQSNVQVRDEHDNIVVIDDETRDIIDGLRSRPDMKMLFSVSKKATPEDIIKAVKIIEALKDNKEGDH